MFMVLSSWPKSLREFTRLIWWTLTERRVAANPQTKPTDLGCESADNWQLSSTSTIAIVISTQPVDWYSFYCPTKGGRLSRPKHCSKGAQPVLKTVYRSSCRDKHNCQRRDSNLDPLTPQSDTLTTRLLRPALEDTTTLGSEPCVVGTCGWVFLEVVSSLMETCESQQQQLHGDGLHQQHCVHCCCLNVVNISVSYYFLT